MPKVAHAAKHHGHAAFVGSGDDLAVAHAAAGLDDAARPGINDHVQAIAEREKRVTRHGRALERQIGVPGFDTGNACRIQAAHLPRAHPHRHAVFAKHDRVGLDVLGNLPGKQQVLQLRWRGLDVGDYFQISQRQLMVVSRLHQHAGADTFHINRV